MAGSWAHMTTSKGKLRNNESFCGMIENLGDAYEAAEECYGMVQWLAQQLSAVYERANPGTVDAREELIKSACGHYRDGLRIGGVQRPR